MKFIFKDIKPFFELMNLKTNWVHTHRYADTDTINIGNNAQIEPMSAIIKGSTWCTIGSFSYIRSSVASNLKIGRYCSISSGLSALGSRHPYEWATTSPIAYNPTFILGDPEFKNVTHYDTDYMNIEIGHDVWIGDNVALGPTVKIGHGAVIAAHSVVVKDVLPFEIVGGNPAKHIKFRFPKPTRDLLLQSSWWDYHFKDFETLNFQDPQAFAEGLLQLKCEKKIIPYTPSVLNVAAIKKLLYEIKDKEG